MVDLNYKLMGQRLRTIRKKKKLTQEQVAEKADISPQHYSGVETGSVKISLPALIRVANALNVSMDELLLDSVSAAAKPGLMKEVETIFGDATPNETYLMLAQAKSIKEAVRTKGLLSYKG